MMVAVSVWTGQVASRQLTRNWRDWVGLAARLVLGIGLAWAGLLKVGRLEGNVAQVELFQLPFPGWMTTAIGYAQPFVEIAVGVMLIIGLFTRINAALGTVAMAAFIAGIAWAWSKGLRIDCGCFSIGGQLGADEQTQYIQDILRDIGLMAAGVWLWVRPASVLAVDTWLLRPVSGPDEGFGAQDDLDEQVSSLLEPESSR